MQSGVKRRSALDPVLLESPPFPHTLGSIAYVQHNGAPWRGRIHRIAVNERTCTVQYHDGSVEANVLPARICEHGPSSEEASLAVPQAEHEPQAEPESEPEPTYTPEPAVEPRFTSKASITKLNKCFARSMKARLKKWKHKCKWCCHLRHDMPYFVAKLAEDAGGKYIEPQFVHGTVAMTKACNIARSRCASISAIDDYLHLEGALLAAAADVALM